METSFFIEKKAVFNEVVLTAEYIAAKNDNYERISIVDENEELLNLFWDEACNDVFSALRDFCPIFNNEDTTGAKGCMITVCVPDNWNSLLQPTVQNEIKNYLITKISSEWLTTVTGNTNEDVNIKLVGIINKILLSLFTRKRPERPNYEEG